MVHCSHVVTFCAFIFIKIQWIWGRAQKQAVLTTSRIIPTSEPSFEKPYFEWAGYFTCSCFYFPVQAKQTEMEQKYLLKNMLMSLVSQMVCSMYLINFRAMEKNSCFSVFQISSAPLSYKRWFVRCKQLSLWKKGGKHKLVCMS